MEKISADMLKKNFIILCNKESLASNHLWEMYRQEASRKECKRKFKNTVENEKIGQKIL